MLIDGRPSTALLDTGCSRTIVSERLNHAGELKAINQRIVMMNGESVEVKHTQNCKLVVGGRSIVLECLVSDILRGYDILLGMDVVAKMGGVRVSSDGRSVQFDPKVACSAALSDEPLRIEDKDFDAEFVNGSWRVAWRWVSGHAAPKLGNWVSQYRMKPGVEEAFCEEIEEWIAKGWLKAYEGEHDGLVPLMAVAQPNKGKVRPVLDFRELNEFVSSHTGQSVVCAEKLRAWRKLGRNVTLVDLRKAYLQIHVDKSLWRYQVVRFKGRKYCLTRLGFGLNVAPKIMTAIINKVFSLDSEVRSGTDSYIDDIIVNEQIVSSQRVINLLKSYGLEAKPAVPLVGARVLGLRVSESHGKVVWGRDNVIDPPSPLMTKRQIFSMCGKLIGHFPVASWLRPACSFLKRLANSSGWDSKVSDRVIHLAKELWDRVLAEDPVRGVWDVGETHSGRVWCDASSLAIGVCLEIKGEILEDASWLRREDDSAHINLAELDAVLRGVNLALVWGVKKLEVMTDSRTVYGWIKDLVTEECRIKTHGLGEALVRRRLGLLRDILTECSVELSPTFVFSAENKSDRLTRVPKHWLAKDACFAAVDAHESESKKLITAVHNEIHCGVDKTFYLAKVVNPDIVPTRQEVEDVVGKCLNCKSIDPAPIRWKKGSLEVEGDWVRLACDVTQYAGKKFLTIIDSGPSRYALWKAIPDESLTVIADMFETVFCEFGPPKELLLDNSATFKSGRLVAVCQTWNVKVIYRAAYRPSGNGIIERHHRTVKRIAARTKSSIQKAVFWYNFLPRVGTDANSCPHSRIFCYSWTCPLRPDSPPSVSADTNFAAGDAVLVKPPNARCTTRWNVGRVTRVSPEGAVDVNGIHRHVGDIRLLFPGTASGDSSDREDERNDISGGSEPEPEPAPTVRRSSRVTAQPWRYDAADYL